MKNDPPKNAQWKILNENAWWKYSMKKLNENAQWKCLTEILDENARWKWYMKIQFLLNCSMKNVQYIIKNKIALRNAKLLDENAP